MFSAILMAAMVGSTNVPDFFFCHKPCGNCFSVCAPVCAPVVAMVAVVATGTLILAMDAMVVVVAALALLRLKFLRT